MQLISSIGFGYRKTVSNSSQRVSFGSKKLLCDTFQKTIQTKVLEKMDDKKFEAKFKNLGMTQEQLIAFDVLLNDGHEHKDTALERARNRDFFYIDATNPHDLGIEYVNQLGMKSLNDMTDYFDYEQYGYSLLANNVYEETYDEDNNFTGFQLNNTDMVLPPSIVTEEDLGEYHVEQMYGGVNNLSDDDLEFYFDYDKLGDILEYDFTKTKNGYIQV
jgi:hypothetical protein